MKIIHNKFIPFGDFGSMNILGLVFTKTPVGELSDRTKQHEGIHARQQYELLTISAIFALILCNIFASWWYLLGIFIIPFALYAMSFLLELCIPPYYNAKGFFSNKCFCVKLRSFPAWIKKVWMDAYFDNCFEREAFANDEDANYLVSRPVCAWLWYILPMSKRKE